MAPDNNKRRSVWKRLFPGADEDRRYETGGMPVAPAATITAGPYQDYEAIQRIMNGGTGFGMGPEDGVAITEMPIGRIARYAIYEIMETDPSINAALCMHVSAALSGDPKTGEIFNFESKNELGDPIVDELRDVLHERINRDITDWAYRAACYGIHFLRPYGEQGKGITNIRSDHYTHPRFINSYESGGEVRGYTAAHQAASGDGVRLMDPWKIVPIKIPISQIRTQEPVRVDMSGQLVEPDISLDDRSTESLVETANYGQSFLHTAWGPWFDLQNAILSLNASRHNAARLERMVGVNTGRLDPTKAAEYVNIVAQNMRQTADLKAKRNLLRGFYTTVINHIMPIFGDGKGRLDISSIEGNPNIEALADIDFHVKRLGSALGIDPALLGFGETLSGGLGDGGFFRLSIIAAHRASAIRIAMAQAIDRICDIHIAYKYGKVYLPTERPWSIVFKSVASSLERENAENMETRAQLSTTISQVVQSIDSGFDTVDKRALLSYVFTDIIRMPEDQFEVIFPEAKAIEAEKKAKAGDQQGADGDQQFDEDGNPIEPDDDQMEADDNSAEDGKKETVGRGGYKNSQGGDQIQENAELDQAVNDLVDELVKNRLTKRTVKKSKGKRR